MGISANTRHVLIISIGILAVLVLLEELGKRGSRFRPLDRLENAIYDWRTRLGTEYDPVISTNLGVVFLDDKTAAKLDKGVLNSHRSYGSYRYGFPYPRFIHGDFLDLLRPYSPSLICYDIFFLESYRDDHPTFPDAETNELLHSDEIFADDLRRSGNVVLAMDGDVLPDVMFRETVYAMGHISAEPDFDGVLRRVKPFQDGKIWHEVFERTLGQVAGLPPSEAIFGDDSVYWVSEDPETGEEIRTFEVGLNENGEFDVLDAKFDFGNYTSDQIIQYFGGKRYHQPYTSQRFWHMGFVMAARRLGLVLEDTVYDSESGKLEIPDTSGKIHTIPLTSDGSFVIPWRFTVNESKIHKASLSDFFEPEDVSEDPEVFFSEWKDKIILIGSNATGNNLRDISATPLSVTDFAMMTHMNVANAILTGKYTNVVPGWVIYLLTIMGVGLAAFISIRLSAPYDSLVVLVSGFIYLGLAVWIFVGMDLVIPVAMPVVGGLGMTHVMTVANRALTEQKEKSRIKRVFGQTVSPNVVNVLLKENTSELAGSTEDITTVFSDIRGFTDITDSLESRAQEYARSIGLDEDQVEDFIESQTRAMLQAVNENLSIQAESIKIYNGTLDKYIGDCVMAFWGAPSNDKEHALHCVQSTIASHKAMLQLNVRREAQNRSLLIENRERIKDGVIPIPLKPLLDMGAGINSGKAIVGLVGSSRHISNYTVFGRGVNLAARLEGISGRGRIRVGETTLNQILDVMPEFKEWIIKHPPTQLKGFSQAIPTYEVMWWKVSDALAPAPEIPLDLA